MGTPAATLPFIDELSVSVDASPKATWEAVLRVAEGSFASPIATRFARLVGCADTEASGPRPLTTGSAFTGFHVEGAEQPHELVLAGSHRFSNYALTFRLDDRDGSGTLVRAETRAEFPGSRGSVYRTLVIGTRGHVLATRRLLAAVKRLAERG